MEHEFKWKNIQEKLEGALGDVFLEDLHQFIPKGGPSLDIMEDEDHLCVFLEVPGIPHDSDSISIYTEGFHLLIEGYIPCPYEKKWMIKSERFFGNFKRKVTLPITSKLDNIDAIYRNGLLVITVPKEQNATSTKVPLKFDKDTKRATD